MLLKNGKEILQSFDLNDYISIKLTKKTISFEGNKTVKKLVCNDKVVHFITSDGRLYSFGEDTEKLGYLGLGGLISVSSPYLNPNLSNCNLIDISISETHFSCVDSKKLLN